MKISGEAMERTHRWHYEGRENSAGCKDQPGSRRKEAKQSKWLTKEEEVVLLNKNKVRVQGI